MGYTTHKLAPSSSVHPSKRQRHAPVSRKQIDSVSNMEIKSGASSNNVSSSNEDSSDEESELSRRKTPSATYQATKLVASQSLSTNKAS